jgi:hypothetical protein
MSCGPFLAVLFQMQWRTAEARKPKTVSWNLLYDTSKRCLGAQPRRERQGYKDKNISEGYTGEETCDVSGPSPAVY